MQLGALPLPRLLDRIAARRGSVRRDSSLRQPVCALACQDLLPAGTGVAARTAGIGRKQRMARVCRS